ncbi:MAG: flagellar hook-length control protein FliK [Agathobacter sp.]|nr:flagellar hook-length control protein FliK [Agathobacter sp.]
MHISDLLGHYNSSVTQSEPITKTKGVEKLVEPLSEFETGNVFEGTVSSVKGNKVILSLANGSQVSARLSTKINLEKGQSMFFQVKSNSGNTVEIRPFTFGGSGANYTLLEALKTAGLATDANNLAMVNKMMEEQMSIDRNSLIDMARVAANNSNINVETLVQMQKLGLPISVEMASQFENYLGDKQAIGKVLEEFMNELPNAFGNNDMPVEQIKLLSSQILSVVTEGLAEGNPENNLGSILNDNQLLDLNEAIQRLLPEWGEENSDITGEGQLAGSQDQTIKDMNGQSGALQDVSMQTGVEPEEAQTVKGQNEQGVNTQNDFANIEQAGVSENKTADIISGQSADGQSGTVNLENSVAQTEHGTGELGGVNSEVLIEEAQDMGYSKEAGTVEVLKDIQTLIDNSAKIDKDTLLKLFSNDNFKTLVKDALEQQWLIKPQDLAREADVSKKINKLYEKVEEQLAKLEQVVKASGQTDTAVSSLAAEIRNNVEFMNQINQAYTYVQVPLKMAGQSASGELYVYTNKKTLMEKDKELTAFLHLDMDNLGPTDVSVKMLGKDVTTNFYLENDAAYDLLEKNLSILEKRLADKGYNCKINVTNENRHVNFVEDFMKKDMPAAGRVHRYSFDMRA